MFRAAVTTHDRIANATTAATLVAAVVFSLTVFAADTQLVCALKSDVPLRVSAETANCRLSPNVIPFVAEIDGAFVRMSAGELQIGGISDSATDQKSFSRDVAMTAGDANELTLEITSRHPEVASERWIVVIPSAYLSQIKTLRLPHGKYAVSWRATGFTPVTRVLSDSDGETAVAINLTRFPIIRGTVRDAGTWKEIPSATVTTRHGDKASVVNGAFSLVIEKEWPQAILVDSTGYAAALVTVPRLNTDVSLGNITIGRGGSIKAEIVHDGDIAVELVNRNDRQKVLPSLTKKLSVEDGLVEFAGLAEGHYTLRITGKEPLEQYWSDVYVTDGQEAYRTIFLWAKPLRVAAKRGDHPVPNVDIRILNKDARWSATVNSGPEGAIETAFWQPGAIDAVVSTPTGGAFSVDGELREESTALVFEVPNRQLIVSLFDEKTGDALRHGSVVMQHAPPNEVTVGRRVDEDGRAVIDAVESGSLKISGVADGYGTVTTAIELSPTDVKRELRLGLTKTSTIRIRVIAANGAPAAHAYVVTGPADGVASTDSDGMCSVQLPAPGPATIFVVPRDRSLAFIDVDPGKTPGPVTVNVPPGEARLSLRVVERGGAPVAGVGFAIRFNGRPLPPPVVNSLASQQLRRLETDKSGVLTLNAMPVGVYELWPVPRANDPAPPGNAPLRLVAQPGINFAEVTIESAAPRPE